MGTISSGVGLISGMNIDDLVKQLMAIESKPLDQLKAQIDKTKQQQTAYAALSAQLLSAVGALKRLSQASAFQVRKATSSNTDILSAIATGNTPVGSYSFQVRSLASTHQLVSSGFADRDTTPLTGGTLVFKNSAARVDTSTALAALNGIQGVRGGVIRITDRAGGKADIDLNAAVSLDDVLQAINSQSTANVKARIDGDHLVLTDQTGATAGALEVQDLGSGHTASDLGLAGSSTTGELVGRDLVQLVAGTRLSMLNDGMGVRTAGYGDDFSVTLASGKQIAVSLASNLQMDSTNPPRTGTLLAALNDGRGVNLGTIRITNRFGQSKDVSLAGARTINDVMNAINATQGELDVSASLAGSKLVLADGSGGLVTNFKIEDVTGTAAADLGIAADTSGTSITSGTLYRVDTVGAVLRAIQYASGNDGSLVASISADGNGITLTDTTGGGPVTVEPLNGSKAALDLGLLTPASSSGSTLTGRSLLAGLNTVLLSSLNGGNGVGVGQVDFTLRDNTTVRVDFTGAQTLRDVIDRINGATGLSAAVDAGGMGLVITDKTSGSGTLSARDVGEGTTVSDMHWTAAGADQLTSGDLKRQYVSENTLLKDLNYGKGISFGSITITAADGDMSTLTLNATAQKTVGDVIKAINGLGLDVEARINASGDGIELVDHSGGAGALTVAQKDTNTTAADLGILGQAKSGTNTITGSFTKQITIGSGDTLDDLVQKINTAQTGVTARVINDGSPYAPYRLVISSTQSGRQGQIAYNTGTTGLSLGDMTVARDAVVAMTDGSSPNPIVFSSSTNSVTGVLDGLTLNLTGTSSQAVSVNVDEDTDQIVKDMQTFIDSFNSTMDKIDTLTKYIPDTGEKGILLGDHAVMALHDSLFDEVNRVISGSGLTYKTLSQVGITIGSGSRLALDQEKFTKAFEKDPEGVQKLFTLTTKDDKGKTVNLGIAARLGQVLTDMNDDSGILGTESKTLQDRVDMYNNRATEMQGLLDKKQARLYAQFQAMEEALAKLQGQQSALASLSSLASSAAASSGLGLG